MIWQRVVVWHCGRSCSVSSSDSLISVEKRIVVYGESVCLDCYMHNFFQI